MERDVCPPLNRLRIKILLLFREAVEYLTGSRTHDLSFFDCDQFETAVSSNAFNMSDTLAIDMLSISTHHLTRFRDIGWLLAKYGFSDLVRESGLNKAFDDEDVPETDDSKPEEFAADLERLGPTYIKVGQFLSTRPDLISQPYIDSLSRLQDSIEAAPYEQIEEVIISELGARTERLFRTFEKTPLASASLGQVHRATLHNGREVVVKVQRPGIRKTVAEDLDALTDFAEFVDNRTEWGKKYEFGRQLETLRKSLLQELDYTIEATNTSQLAENMQEFDLLRVPKPILDYSTSRVLTLEYIEGEKITDVDADMLQRMDSPRLAEELFNGGLHQILVNGFFHADPHPGNLLLTRDGRIALLDVGMVGKVAPEDQQFLVQLLIAVSEGRGADAAEVAIRMGAQREDFDHDSFVEKVAQIVSDNRGATVSQVKFGGVMFEIQRIASESGLRLPLIFTLLGKAMLNLDETIETLSPDMDVYGQLRSEAGKIMQRRATQNFSPGQIYSSMLEVGEFFTRFPDRINKIMDLVASNKLSVNVEAVDEVKLLKGIQKVANRISMGLLLAALIIGASILMHVDSAFTVFGLPFVSIVAMTFFLLAGCGAVYMVVKMFISDF